MTRDEIESLRKQVEDERGVRADAVLMLGKEMKKVEELTRKHNNARADLREFVRQVECAYELLKPLEDDDENDVIDRAMIHLLTVLRGHERPGPWLFDRVVAERDEARAEVERLRALLKTVPVEFEPGKHE